ncbi:hypothetical protein U6M47_12520, partial [Cutibacterium acnes]
VAADALGEGWTPAELMAATDVTGDSSSTVLSVSCSDGAAERAVACADAVASAYLGVRADRAQTMAASLTSTIDARIAELSQQLADALARQTSGSGASQATAEAELARSEIEALLTQRTSLATLSENAGDVITPADAGDVSVAPSPLVVIGGGLLAGVLLGVVAALVRDRYAQRLSDSEQLADLVDAPVWQPDTAPGTARWGTAAELFRYALEGRESVAVA